MTFKQTEPRSETVRPEWDQKAALTCQNRSGAPVIDHSTEQTKAELTSGHKQRHTQKLNTGKTLRKEWNA